MQLSIDSTFWLVCAAVLVVAALTSWRLLGAMAWQRRSTAIVARTLLLAAIGLALAGLSSVRTVDRVAVVAVVDMSRSAHVLANAGNNNTFVRNHIEAWLEAVDQQKHTDDLLGVVAFDGRAIVVQTPTRSRVGDVQLEIPSREGTNIEQAIAVARAMLPAQTQGRILLVTDGNETIGDALGSVASRGDTGSVPIDVVPIRYSLDNEVAVTRLDAPGFVQQGADIPVRAFLQSSTPLQGEIRLFDGDDEIDLNGDEPGAALPVSINAGQTVVPLTVPGSDRRLHDLRIAFEPPTQSSAGVSSADLFLENNIARAITLSPGRGRVLVVTDTMGSQRTPLTDAVESTGYSTDVRVPSALPVGLAGFAEYDTVVLDDVSADSLIDETRAALDQYVRSLGGGLIVVGGMNSFGPGGYRGTELEHLVPLLLDIPDRLIRPDVAIMIVLDRSGSMAQSVLGSVRSQQDIANEAAAIAVSRLEPTDLVGVIAFDNSYSRVVPLAPNKEPRETSKKIRSIRADGGTNLGPALKAALSDLEKVDAEKKHIVVLSDGRSQAEETLPDIAREVAAKGVTITSISVGDGSAAPKMREIAEITDGTFFEVVHPDRLPRVFIDAVRVERSPRVLEQQFVPQLVFGSSPILAGFPSLPLLDGLVLTRERPDPRAILIARGPDNLPLLAEWQVELGRVVAFTSDSDRWSSRWLTWDGYRKFWSQIVQRVSKPAQSPGFIATIAHETDTLTLTLETLADDAEPIVDLRVEANVIGPDGKERVVELWQVAPGVYETSTPVEEQGAYVAAIRAYRGQTMIGTALAAQIVENERELDDLKSNNLLVAEIAKQSNGRVLDLDSPGQIDMFSREGIEPARARSSLWQLLVWIALGIYMCDIATRRIAWDRLLGLGERTMASVTLSSTGSLTSLASRETHRSMESTSALSDLDAARVVAKQQQSRRESVIEQLRASRTQRPDSQAAPIETMASDISSDESSAESSGLLAAKRRAMQRFEENESD